MLKLAIALNVVLLLITVPSLVLAFKQGSPPITTENWMLPCFGLILLATLIDAAQTRAKLVKLIKQGESK